MDSLAVPPRLRQMRQQRQRVDHLFDTPQAGPSRISTHADTLGVSNHDESDTEATPRVSSKPPIGFSGETPEHTSRLRTAMSMMPSQTAKPIPQRAPSSDYSVVDSDFEAPNMTTYANDASSIAKRSLAELFSRAKEESPQRDRTHRRRNSIDASEVESSPRIEILRRERAKAKGKRKSLSDEETEKFARVAGKTELSEAAYTSTAALAYDRMRQRISDVVSIASISPLKNTEHASTTSGSVVDMDEEAPAEHSGDTASTFRQLAQDTASFALPAGATSTPMRSAVMPPEIQMHSNLMSQDSEMQNAMQGLDTMDADSTINKTQRRYPFPDSRPSAPSRPGSSEHAHSHAGAHDKSHSAHNLPFARRVSMDSISSRGSSMSGSDFKDRSLYERERSWNKPGPRSPAHNTTPDRRHSSFDSPPHGVRSRRNSSAFDDYSSYGGSSIGSRADYRDRMRDMDDERNRERERNWNHPHTLSRSTSSLDLKSPGERHRHQSTPSRPDSAQSFHTPSRPQSWHYGRGDSRASSPANSVASYGREPRSEPRNPVAHERERNWNARTQKWEYGPPPRPVSPSPQSLSASHSHRRLSNASPSPSHSQMRVGPGSARNRTVSLGALGATPEKSTSPLVRRSVKYKEQLAAEAAAAASGATPPRPGSTDSDGPANDAFGSRFGWTFPRNHHPLPPLELDDESQHGSRPSSRLSLSSDRPSKIPVRSPGKGSPAAAPKRPAPPSPSVDLQRRLGHRRSVPEIASEIPAHTPRVVIEPVDLINAQTEDLVPTDIETDSAESDLESQVTSTPLARPSTIPEESEHAPQAHAPSSPSPPATPPMPPATIPEEPEHEEPPPPAKPQTPPPSSPRRAEHTSPLFGLRTPPRRPQFNTSKLEFQTPSPPPHMPDLPGPPSSDEENELQRTPSKSHGSINGNLTMMKTPRPPGAWALTPAPVEKPEVPPREPTPPPPNFAGLQETPVQHADTTSSKTPAPPGAWQNTPITDSMRKKGILKVRFDVESNASGDTTLDEIPLVGPSSPQIRSGDSISEVFPAIPGDLALDKSRKSRGVTNKENEAVVGPSSSRARSPKSPGVRVVDAFGRETVQEPSPASSQEPSSKSSTETEADKGKEVAGPSSPRNRSAVRIVDAMGREVAESEDPNAEDSVELPEPRSHSEALRRIRKAVSDLADDFSDSEDSQAVTLRNEQRLKELYATSQAARAARQGLSDSLKKHKDTDAELRARYGSLREGMQRRQLLQPPAPEEKGRFTVNFQNVWILWGFLILQLVLLLYMYWYSTIRAKRIFLTTYYDAFEPALFAHIPKSDSLQRGSPSPSSVSSPFSVPDALFRSGFKGFLKESWSRISAAANEWQVQIWEAWKREARTNAWPPT